MLAAPPGDGRGGATRCSRATAAYVARRCSPFRRSTRRDGSRGVPASSIVLATPSQVVTIRKSGSRGDARARRRRSASRVEAGAGCGAVVQACRRRHGGRLPRASRRALRGDRRARERRSTSLRGADVRRRMGELRHELLRRATVRERDAGASPAESWTAASTSAAPSSFPPDVEAMFVDTYETLVRVTEELDVARDLLGGVRDYYQAKITEQQNDVSKKLTVIASPRARAEPDRRASTGRTSARRSTAGTGASACRSA